MRFESQVGAVNWIYETDDSGISVRKQLFGGSRNTAIPWSEIIVAGYVRSRELSSPAALPPIVPGLDKLIAKGIELGEKTDLLMIVYNAGGRKKRTLFSFDQGSLGKKEFLLELERRLSERWIGQEQDYLRLARRLGYHIWWIWPLLPLVLILGLAIFLLLLYLRCEVLKLC